ncbi:MAG: AAA family ATPase [Armatimonadetes bacterium]|nr:AAA family ATPase [Armatimonadota bacterium]
MQSLTVEGFRSIRGLEVRFGNVNLITGPNGCGKSNLFNAFRIVKAAVQGNLAGAVAEQGGMESLLWAGPRQKGPVRVKLGVVAEPFEYEIEFGLRPRSEFAVFPLDPQIKQETVKLAGRTMVDRRSNVAHIRGLDGPLEMRSDLVDSESIFAQIRGAQEYPYLYSLRDIVERWTFYHEFRTDAESPLRRPTLGRYAPRLFENGFNLAPQLFLIQRSGDFDALEQVLKTAFPDAVLYQESSGNVQIRVDGIERPMGASELSDGTLKFLCLAAACFPVRPAPLVAFNEPESSLSPAALLPLADALAYASVNSQLWITSHSEALTKALVDRLDCKPIRLSKVDGETVRDGRSLRHGYVPEE